MSSTAFVEPPRTKFMGTPLAVRETDLVFPEGNGVKENVYRKNDED